MAYTRGCSGLVEVGSAAVAAVTAWELTESVEIIDTSTINNSCDASFTPGKVTRTGTVSCWWDATDTTGQEVMTPGATVTLTLKPEGDTTGDVTYSGSVVITEVSYGGSVDGAVTRNFSFRVDGAWTEGAVA